MVRRHHHQQQPHRSLSFAMTDTIDTKPKAIIRISILALLFGTGSWIALTGLWLEMPLLLQQLPEQWRLASYLNIMIQLANIGPLLYWLLKRYRFVNDISATHIQMLIGLISCIMLIGYWRKTFWIFGHEHSVILLIFTFGLALVDCTSSVTFLPFMARFDSNFMTPYLFGEGLSGFIPSLVVLIQGVGQQTQQQQQNVQTTNIIDTIDIIDNNKNKLIEPKFSVEIFFTSLFITLIISYLAFILLEFASFTRCEQRRIKRLNRFNRTLLLNNNIDDDDDDDDLNLDLNETANQQQQQQQTIDNHDNKQQKSTTKTTTTKNEINHTIYFYLLGLMFWNSFTTFGFMPPLQPFSAMPYSADTLHFVVILTSLSYPIGCFLAMLFEYRSIRMITIMTIVSTLFAGYILIVSLMSPLPPFIDNGKWHTIASWLIVFIWSSFMTIASYAKTMITIVICDYNRSKGMFWVGMQTQFGSAIGAAISFILINYTDFFDQCY
ncbi:hypothetical protein DERP_008479 [Dermatophagoides pteronyssinus]|uniref:Riboflavin transporter n=2 Tax=Dermatophagoides pteronyssinus TaxID=6956 RepID=A0ABQ8IVQ4_DERPT|nr:hypothetical protein DERP_008479 [Dermatophagoides pteronyssinus]